MHVRVVYFAGCPNHESAVELIREVADSLGAAVVVEEVLVESPEEAVRERMLGSPTIQVDGLDVEPDARARTDYAMSCRVYGGRDGLPSRELIAAAIRGEKASCEESAGDDEGCC